MSILITIFNFLTFLKWFLINPNFKITNTLSQYSVAVTNKAPTGSNIGVKFCFTCENGKIPSKKREESLENFFYGVRSERKTEAWTIES